jgi:hypothetical protein
LLALVTDDDIYGRVSEKKTMKEKVSYVYQREKTQFAISHGMVYFPAPVKI